MLYNAQCIVCANAVLVQLESFVVPELHSELQCNPISQCIICHDVTVLLPPVHHSYITMFH